MSTINLTVNGRSYTVDVDPTTPLLYVLNDDLALNGPKFGCGLGQCGACTVLLGSAPLQGTPVRSCITPVTAAEGLQVTTLEGLGTLENSHPLQRTFIHEQAAQCGYCLSGVMLTGKAFIDANPTATEAQIMQALNGILCRCYTHVRMVKALTRYAEEVRS